MDSQYPTAPELPRKVPQLVRDGKSPETPEAPEEPAYDDPLAPEEAEDPDELNELVESPGDPDGVIASEEAERLRAASTPVAEPTQNLLPASAPKPKKKRKWWLILLAVVLLAAIGTVVYLVTTKKAATPATKSTATEHTSTAKTTPEADTTKVATKKYDSATYTLSFAYPENWVVSDTAAKLTITSPVVQLTPAAGSATSAHVVVTIQNPQASIPGYPAGGALAALASEKLTYAQPTSVQRAQTYLSYLGYKATGLDALYITGDNGYQQGQTIPMSDVAKSNPLISITFATCGAADCSTGTVTQMALDAAAWQKSATATQVTELLKSLQFN
jgi:hypothetical protein